MRLLMAFLISAQASASTVLVQGPGTSDLDYRAALRADPDSQSPSRTSLKQRPAATARELLLKSFAEAQKSFLENSNDEAGIKFSAVTALLTSDDWEAADRRLFLHAFLRLAQLRPEKEELWLRQALACGEDVQPEPGLFPPPLLQKLAAARANVKRVSAPTGWTMVLLNGYPCGPECKGIPLTEEKIRLTFLSDTFQTVTQILDPARLASARIAQTPWAQGSCADSRVAWAGAKVFWGLDCETPAKTLNLHPVAVRAQELPRFEIHDQAPAFYKSKWFWGGVALATVAAIVINGQKRQRQEREPTTTYGYQ